MTRNGRGRAGRAHRDRGQAAVELVLALPVLCLFAFGTVQVAVIVADQMSVLAAAREGARAAAVAADPSGAARAAALDATELRPLTVETHVGADRVTVTVHHTTSTDVALVGALLPALELRSSVTMALEPP